MIRPWLRNPWETAAVAALAAAGMFYPYALAAGAVLFAALEIAAGLRNLEGPRWCPSLWPRGGPAVIVLYDSHCVLCTRSKEKLEKWRTAPSMRFLPLESPEARALVPDMDEKRYQGAMHVIEKGTISSAHEGWFRLMKLAPLPLALLAGMTPTFLARPLYAVVARNRYRWFGRLCGGSRCQVHVKA